MSWESGTETVPLSDMEFSYIAMVSEFKTVRLWPLGEQTIVVSWRGEKQWVN